MTDNLRFDVPPLGLQTGPPPDPCVIVIFGAGGDLTRRELVPSLFELHGQRLLPDPVAVIGFSQSGWDTAAFRERMRGAVQDNCRSVRDWDSFATRLSFVAGDAASDPKDAYAALASEIARVQSLFAIPDNVLFHMAVPPALFPVIAQRLGASGLAASPNGWRRLVVEKPFGTDRESARALDRQLGEVFGEEQIYRVDHYLGKETVQNMLVFRFANPSFEPIWNRNYIDHIQITAAEAIGIGTRAAFYEQTGVVRDMVQNHLLQLLCMVAMEPPLKYDAKALRDETRKVLEAVVIPESDVELDAVRGQYAEGTVADRRVPGYRAEPGVSADSVTPTFAALKLTLKNWRWSDVPIYLRTGKRLARPLTEVAIQFKPTPHLMFPHEPGSSAHQSVLAFEVQPDEGIIQTIAAKQPGPELSVRTVTMHFRYAEAFGIEEPPRAYAWLLRDAMQGDQTLFARADWIDRAWEIVDPIVKRWTSEPPRDFPNYGAGSQGPAAADQLIQRDGRRWRDLTPPPGSTTAVS
jgi:glucose-6-phosphate 1-dehydrogenase